MLTAQDYIDHARDTLFDPAPGAGWSDTELIRYLNAAQTAVVALKPNALPAIRQVGLDPGVVQVLPDDGVMFMDVLHGPGNSPVTVQSLHEVTRVQDGWKNASGPGDPEYVLYDPRVPTQYCVFPPAPSGTFMTIIFGTMPTRIVAASDTVELSDVYETALWSYVVAMANMKQSKRHDADQFKAFMETFATHVAAITKNEATMAAKVDIKGEMG